VRRQSRRSGTSPSGDEAVLRAILPEDFLAIDAGGTEISDRNKTIAVHPGWHLERFSRGLGSGDRKCDEILAGFRFRRSQM
jgi:hypothetical protein